jgi:peptidoglycan/LPS O-acetylase OafA/YrhL
MRSSTQPQNLAQVAPAALAAGRESAADEIGAGRNGTVPAWTPRDAARFDVLRFPLIVAVVFIHNYDSAIHLANGTVGVQQPALYVEFIRRLVSLGFAQVAVPLFFLMSGYLFFLNFDGSLEAWRSKMVSRVRTLLVPLVLWGLLNIAVVWLGQSNPATGVFFSGSKRPVIAELHAFGFVDAVFGITGPPLAYQFWFIRDLILLVLLAPLVHAILRRSQWGACLLLGGLWLSAMWPLRCPSADASFFFVLGATLAYQGHKPFPSDRWRSPLILAYVLLLIADALLYAPAWSHRIAVAVGVPAVLASTDLVVDAHRLRDRLLWLMPSSFFVFAAHEPLLTALRKLAYIAIRPSSSVAVLSLYLLVPAVAIIVLVAAWRGLRSASPKALALATGGR